MEKGGYVKKLVVLVTLCLSVCAFGDVVDIQFSPGGGTPGSWLYDGYTTLSFSQVVNIDIVEGATSDALFGQQVYIPDLELSEDYAEVTPDGPIKIKDAAGNVLLSGTLAAGDFVSFSTIGAMYTEYASDIIVTSVDNSELASDFLGTIGVDSILDFNLTLQFNENFSDIWGDHNEHGNGFSGSMDRISDPIPEPATIILLGLGSLALLRKGRTQHS